MKRSLLLLLVTAATGRCGGPKEPTAETELRTCVVGWWQDTGTTCGVYCPGPEPCSDQDCKARSTIGLLNSGRSLQCLVLVAPTIRKFSSTTPPIAGQWAIDESKKLKMADSGISLLVTCTAQRLSFETASYFRVSGDLATALSHADDAGSWSNHGY